MISAPIMPVKSFSKNSKGVSAYVTKPNNDRR